MWYNYFTVVEQFFNILFSSIWHHGCNKSNHASGGSTITIRPRCDTKQMDAAAKRLIMYAVIIMRLWQFTTVFRLRFSFFPVGKHSSQRIIISPPSSLQLSQSRTNFIFLNSNANFWFHWWWYIFSPSRASQHLLSFELI